MAANTIIQDLQSWDARIRKKVEAFGLDCYPQEFELCDHLQMLSLIAYSGMPSHYPHWSFGKSYERQKTLYDYGVSGLPYEMVINSDPCLAYLMRGNSLCLQVLTIAHVYGHNDFFKKNFTFGHLRAELVVETFKNHANRVRKYEEDPSIGPQAVEAVLDAAHALSWQCSRNPAIRKRDPDDQMDQAMRAAEPPVDPFAAVHKRPDYQEPDLHRVPLEPEGDILLFIRDHAARLSEWEQDLLTIVHERARYFLPQMETKIMNEGWATYWHRTIMNSLELPQDLHMEFLVRHNQVVRPIPGDINPYHVGLKIWDDIEERHGRDKMFEVRDADRDVSFLRRFLTEDLMGELNLIEYEAQNGNVVVSKVSDADHWQAVKNTLLANVGAGSVPVIRIVDADHGGARGLVLEHDYDGRELLAAYVERTMRHLHTLWGRTIVLRTRMNDEDVELVYDGDEFSSKKAA